jgi:hypothetical protein
MDGNDTWWNHNGHLAMSFRSFITSIENPLGWNGSFPLNVGWNVEWNRDMFRSGVLAWYTLPMPVLNSSNSFYYFKRICSTFM